MKHHSTTLTIIILASVAASAGCSQSARSNVDSDTAPTDFEPSSAPNSRGDPALAQAVARHLLGVGGDEEAASDALERLVELRGRYPDDPRVLSYLGSARVLAASRLVLPWEKGQTCKEGLALLDRAVALASEDPELRFVRAVSTYPLPWFFDRRAQCEDDLSWLAARWEVAVENGSMTAPMAALALLYHGEFCASREDTRAAREAWETSARLCPHDNPGRLARDRLQELADGGESGE